MAKKVYIAVGHGGDDPGAVANGFREKDLNLVTAIACKDELLRNGVEVNIDRTTDIELTMTQTVDACNKYAPDLAVDIHHNAGGGDGAEVFYSIHGGLGKTLAVNILDAVKAIGQNSRGAKTRKGSSGDDYYGFIRRTTPPAVIVECAFLDNKTDVQIVDTKAEQKAMGVAIAKGILKTLGIAYKAESVPETDVLYCVQVGAFAVKANGEKLLAKLKAAGYNDAFITTKPHK
jgi:N-acetylmuramoyl-L-alanine amidase